MILVDSCVWIDFLKGNQTPATKRLLQIQEAQTPEICISSVIYFEVLRGISSDLERKKVKRAFDLLERREVSHEGFDRLVELDIATQKKGIRVGKLGNWLILKTILDHGLSLLTSDKDFYHLQKFIAFSIESFES